MNNGRIQPIAGTNGIQEKKDEGRRHCFTDSSRQTIQVTVGTAIMMFIYDGLEVRPEASFPKRHKSKNLLSRD